MSLPPAAYNPSILRYRGKLLMTCRSHSRGDWRTQLYICELSDALSVEKCSIIAMPDDLARHSFEDARLYEYQDSLWMACTVSQYPTTEFRSIVLIAQLIQNETGWAVGQHFAVQYAGNDFSRVQKNWICFEA